WSGTSSARTSSSVHGGGQPPPRSPQRNRLRALLAIRSSLRHAGACFGEASQGLGVGPPEPHLGVGDVVLLAEAAHDAPRSAQPVAREGREEMVLDLVVELDAPVRQARA